MRIACSKHRKLTCAWRASLWMLPAKCRPFQPPGLHHRRRLSNARTNAKLIKNWFSKHPTPTSARRKPASTRASKHDLRRKKHAIAEQAAHDSCYRNGFFINATGHVQVRSEAILKLNENEALKMGSEIQICSRSQLPHARMTQEENFVQYFPHLQWTAALAALENRPAAAPLVIWRSA